jgi:hypothetical protein
VKCPVKVQLDLNGPEKNINAKPPALEDERTYKKEVSW